MPADRIRTTSLRGALAGAVAAGLWAAQEPLDRRVFGVPYSDVELLGRTTRSAAWRPIGALLHVGNGALFGALYARVAPSLPGPSWARGLAAGMAEHLATWPSTALVGRLHPEGERFPRLWGDHRAFAQATWRHALFGVLLGTVERRLNP
jgi:hypothetical protein